VFAFLELTMRAMRIDPDRVHFTGFSQGGFMTWRMLCAHADLFASVAPAAACGAAFPHCPFSSAARPSREVPVLYVHGTGDVIIGGCSRTQRDAVVAGWSMTEDTVVSMDANHTWTRYLSPGGNVFEFIDHSWSAYSFLLRGHCMPGSSDIGTERFANAGYGCVDSDVVTWGEAVLAFFQAHPRS
jgi:dienelactone hydrolase